MIDEKLYKSLDKNTKLSFKANQRILVKSINFVKSPSKKDLIDRNYRCMILDHITKFKRKPNKKELSKYKKCAVKVYSNPNYYRTMSLYSRKSS